MDRLEPDVMAAWDKIVAGSQRNEKNKVNGVCQYKVASYSF